MKSALALAAVLLAGSVQAQDAVEPIEKSVATQFAEAIADFCLPVANGTVNISASDVSGDQEIIESQGFSYGIDGSIYERFGIQGSGILNRSVMGHRVIGEDVIVLAVGGQLPGCKTILLRSAVDNLEDEVAIALTELEPQWRELPFADSRQGSRVTMRRFLMRDSEGKPFLINLITTPIPNSDFRLLATVNAVPSNIPIPQGF
ncbi:hypothetical protein [uncultured Erythrobacter sp.]|uniref:hypothetical protein n=1 Tax=uncultured Erythrobacter sp. TaxID=263913 RepID=UPI0026264EE2|nr:hypothetical protein [uncultured Erythrobacter sp.]